MPNLSRAITRFVLCASLSGGCGDAAPALAEATGDASESGQPVDTDGGTGASLPSTSTSSSETGDTPPAPTYTIDIDAALGVVRLLREQTPLLAFESDGFSLGTVDAIDDTLSYDPMFPLAVTWRSVTQLEVDPATPLSLVLTYGDAGQARLGFTELADGRFGAKWQPLPGLDPVAAYRLRARVDATEGFYGLGEVFDTPNHRGKVRPMQIEVELALESSINEAHVPVPLLIGTRGWGLFVHDPHPGAFRVATESDDLVEVTFGTGPDSDDGLEFFLFGAEHPLDITAHYHAVTGVPVLPAAWALGPWLWRNENTGQAQVVSDARTLRALDLPTSALWIDRPYASGVNSFDFDPARYPDPQAMLDELHELGLRVALWHTPYASSDREPAPSVYQEAIDGGYYPPVTGFTAQNWGNPIDFTNPDAYAWWQAHIGEYAAMGIEGYKLDFGEEIVAGLGGTRIPWLFANGSDERTMQSRYQILYHQIYAETLPDAGGFILARSGTIGDQVNASVIWPGDLDANLGRHRAEVEGGLAVGGLPAAVAAGSSLGPSGYPLFASDTGGYRHGPPTRETMIRWFQHTALTPVMQVGTSTSDVVWEYNEANGFDDAMVDLFRDFARLHIRLFPYLWTHIGRVEQDGRPIVRAFGLAYPELDQHPAFDYLLGDDLLVAPVVDAGAITREVHFGPGDWVGWFTGEVHTGPSIETVAAPIETLPLYLRRGGIVPMLRDTVDTLSPTTRPDIVDSFDDDAGILTVRMFTGPGTSAFAVYDGSTIGQDQAGRIASVSVHAGAVFDRGFALELVGNGEATQVFIDGQQSEALSGAQFEGGAIGWRNAPESGGIVRVGVPAGDHTVVVWYRD